MHNKEEINIAICINEEDIYRNLKTGIIGKSLYFVKTLQANNLDIAQKHNIHFIINVSEIVLRLNIDFMHKTT